MVILGTPWDQTPWVTRMLSGTTSSSNFPVTAGALQTANNNPNQATVFVSKIGPNGQGIADLIYSTYYGGTSATPVPAAADFGLGIAVSGTNAYITGQMSASNMLVSSTAFQKTLGGGGTATGKCVRRGPAYGCGYYGISYKYQFWYAGNRRSNGAADRNCDQQQLHHGDLHQHCRRANFTGGACYGLCYRLGFEYLRRQHSGGRNLYGGSNLHAIGERC